MWWVKLHKLGHLQKKVPRTRSCLLGLIPHFGHVPPLPTGEHILPIIEHEAHVIV